MAAWAERDPILRLRRYLEANGEWDDEREQALADEAREWVEAQVATFEAAAPQAPSDIFTHMYAELPPHLEEQMGELAEEVGS